MYQSKLNFNFFVVFVEVRFKFNLKATAASVVPKPPLLIRVSALSTCRYRNLETSAFAGLAVNGYAAFIKF